METLGSYQILGQLGAGGMGTVYLAEHRLLKRRAAIKVLLAELVNRPDVLERFFAEARATSQLEHPGIVRIFDCEIDPKGRPYFVMEFLEGETLAAYLRRRGRLAPSEAVGFARAIADALGAAHERGIVHRDLKPDNVFVRPGPTPAIKLVDFGIAKLTEEFRAVSSARTATGTLLGTPPYMSPEQARGAGNLDHRTDIYSLGCVLFEMLCGVPPFVRDSTGGYLIAHITEPPVLAHDKNPEVPPGLGLVVAALLEKAAEARPQSMREVAAELALFSDPAAPHTRPATVVARPKSLPPSPLPAPEPPARPTTTMRSSAGEVIAEAAAAPSGAALWRRKPVLAVAAAVVAVLGVSIWGLARRPSDAVAPAPVSNQATPPMAAAPAAVTGTFLRAPAKDADKGRPERARAAARPDRPRTAASERPARPRERQPGSAPKPAATPSPPPTAAGGFVVIDIDSKPRGALICYEGDPRILAMTHRAVQLPRVNQPVTFLLDLPGYEPGRFTVPGDRNGKKTIKLKPMPKGLGRRPVCTY